MTLREFEPYGEEWRNHLKTIPKKGLIDMLKVAFKGKKRVESLNTELQAEVERLKKIADINGVYIYQEEIAGYKAKLDAMAKRIEDAPTTHCVEFEGALLLTDLGLDIKEGEKYALVRKDEG